MRLSTQSWREIFTDLCPRPAVVIFQSLPMNDCQFQIQTSLFDNRSLITLQPHHCNQMVSSQPMNGTANCELNFLIRFDNTTLEVQHKAMLWGRWYCSENTLIQRRFFFFKNECWAKLLHMCLRGTWWCQSSQTWQPSDLGPAPPSLCQPSSTIQLCNRFFLWNSLSLW